MTVSLVGVVPRYVLSTSDTFPDPAVIGAQVYAYDKGVEYVVATTAGWTVKKDTLPGVVSTVTHSIVTAATSSKVVLAADATNSWREIINDSTDEIYLNYGGTAVISSGLRLNVRGVAGDRAEMCLGNGNLFQGAISCVTAISSSAINLLVSYGVST